MFWLHFYKNDELDKLWFSRTQCTPRDEDTVSTPAKAEFKTIFFIKLQFHRVIISVKVRIKSNFHLKIEIKVAHCRAGGLWSEDFPEKL